MFTNTKTSIEKCFRLEVHNSASAKPRQKIGSITSVACVTRKGRGREVREVKGGGSVGVDGVRGEGAEVEDNPIRHTDR